MSNFEKKVVPYLTYLGTRPPTVDEWDKYELHHRARLATKPGLTLINFSLAMQILFLLYGFTGNPLYDREMFVPYFIACAISVNYANNRERMIMKGVNYSIL